MTDRFRGVRAVLFDLDGTLIDSAPDLAASLNMVLAAHGLARLSLTDVAGMIGDGIPKLVERGFSRCGRPLAGAAFDAACAQMIDVYGRHLTVSTTLMPAARQTVAALRGAGIAVGLVTNKPQRETEAILVHFAIRDRFGAVIGGDAGFARKPAPDMLLAAIDRLGAWPEATLMVGDSPADLTSARAARVGAILVRGGYTPIPVESLGADAVIDRLDGVLALFDGAAAAPETVDRVLPR